MTPIQKLKDWWNYGLHGRYGRTGELIISLMTLVLIPMFIYMGISFLFGKPPIKMWLCACGVFGIGLLFLLIFDIINSFR